MTQTTTSAAVGAPIPVGVLFVGPTRSRRRHGWERKKSGRSRPSVPTSSRYYWTPLVDATGFAEGD